MGLETASYVTGLTASWPLSGDLKSQGDDHLRLIKAVLQATFPNSSKAFYFPSAEVSITAMVLDATDQNNVIGIDTTASDINVTLPTLGTNDKGWSCEIYRANTGGLNGIMVSPASGVLACPYGNVATTRIEFPIVPVRFLWTGNAWVVIRPGLLIGASMNWDGSTMPAGFRAADGTTYSSTTFAELNLALGTTTLKDKRGRVEAGLDNGSVNRLTASYFGTASALGAVGGAEALALTLAQLPTGITATGSGSVTVTSNNYTASSTDSVSGSAQGGGSQVSVPGSPGGTYARLVSNGTATGVTTTSNNTSGNSHPNVQPTIITNKLVRVA